MEIITFDQIKAQLRLDDEQAALEHDLLEMYGEAAEETVLDLIRRSYTDIIERYGKVPASLRHAILLLVDNSYKERSPASSQNMSAVPYSFDLLVKPYMKLSSETNNNNGYGRHCNL